MSLTDRGFPDEFRGSRIEAPQLDTVTDFLDYASHQPIGAVAIVVVVQNDQGARAERVLKANFPCRRSGAIYNIASVAALTAVDAAFETSKPLVQHRPQQLDRWRVHYELRKLGDLAWYVGPSQESDDIIGKAVAVVR